MTEITAPQSACRDWTPARIVDLQADLTTIANGKNANQDGKAVPNSLS